MLRRMMEEVFRRESVIAPTPVIESTSPFTNLQLVRAGLGLSAVPDSTLQASPRSLGGRRVHVTPAISMGPVALIYRQRRRQPARRPAARHAGPARPGGGAALVARRPPSRRDPVLLRKAALTPPPCRCDSPADGPALRSASTYNTGLAAQGHGGLPMPGPRRRQHPCGTSHCS
ncbi:MAG: LysR substrate-binding domain-containing protein [Delftia tsuruhatensis]